MADTEGARPGNEATWFHTPSIARLHRDSLTLAPTAPFFFFFVSLEYSHNWKLF